MNVQLPDVRTLNANWKILIIDDDEDDFLIAREMLKEAKGRRFDIHWANTYAAGQKELLADPYNAVLVDYDLGIHSGIDLIREANERGYPAPLILLTGRGNYEVDVEAMEAGATMYFSKGEVNPLLLERAIRYAVELRHKEQELRLSEERFYKAFDANPNAQVISRIEDGRIEIMNAGFERLFGYQHDEVIGRTSQDLHMIVNPADREDAVRRIRADNYLRDYELAIRTKSGEIRQASLSVEIVTIGSEMKMLTVIQDITERKQAEAVILKGRATLEASLASMTDAVFITDDQANLIDFNDTFATFHRFKNREECAKTLAEYPDLLDLFLPDGTFAPVEIWPVPRALRGESTTNAEYILRRKDTGESWVGSYSFGPICNQEGSIVGSVVAVRDITESKRAEELLRETQQRLSVIMESIADGVYALDRELRIIYVSDATLPFFGSRRREDLIGHHLYEIFPQVRGSIFDDGFQQALKSGEPVHIEAPSAVTDQFMEFHIYPGPDNLTLLFRNITSRHQMEEALRASEHQQAALAKSLETDRSRLAAVLDHLPVGVWIADPSGQLIGKNEQADRIWAGEAPLLEGIEKYQTYTAWDADSGQMLLPEDYPVAKALKTGQPVAPVELRIRRFDGTQATVLVSAAPIKDSEGILLGAVGVNVDITDRKHFEDRLRASEERLAEFLDSTEDTVMALDRNWRFTYVNRRLCEMLGREPQTLMGQVFQEALPLYAGTFAEQEYQQVFEDKIPVHFQIGGPYSGRWFDVSAYPTREGILVLGRDRTEQHQAEAALREREEVLRLALAAGKAGAWSWDLTTDTMQWSDEYYRIFGFEPGSIAPSVEAGFSHVHPEERQRMEAMVQEAKEHGKQIDAIHRVLWPDGSLHWVRGISNTFHDPEGKPHRMAGIAIDVTQQKQAEDALAENAVQLARSNQDLENFAYIASHDLQEPLRKMKLFGKTLQKNLHGNLDATSEDALERMISASERMQGMIEDLLELSRVNTQGKPFVPVDLAAVANEVVSDLEVPILRTSGQVLVEALPSIEGDPVQIHQVFQNLIANGLKFHQPGIPPLVQVSATMLPSNQGPMVAIQVADNGIGFEAQEFEKILLPFHRLHGRSEFEGTGMGLAIVKKIVERHHGEISVRSIPGQGSTFIFTLPVKQPH